MVLFPFQGSLSPRLPQNWKGSELHVWQLGDCRGRGGGNPDGGRPCREEGHTARGIGFGEGQNLPKDDIIEHFPAQPWFLPLTGSVRSCILLPFPKTEEEKIKMYRNFRPSMSLSSGGGGGERDVPNG